MPRNKSEKVPPHLYPYRDAVKVIIEHIADCNRGCNSEYIMTHSCVTAKLLYADYKVGVDGGLPAKLFYLDSWPKTLGRIEAYIRAT